MIRLAAPGFLLAGALLALVPVALHMLARTPPERRPLPTARFLSLDRRTRLRLRRPADRRLLALRVALIVLLGAAFARPEWLPARNGHAVVVLLDAGSGMAADWEAAVSLAAARLDAGDGVLVVFDSAARVLAAPDEPVLDSLRAAGPGLAPSSYLAALRGLRAAAGSLRADSATAVLVTRPRWAAWSPALPPVRQAAWPAAIEVVRAADAPGTAVPAAPRVARGPAVVVGPMTHPLRPYVEAALQAAGYAFFAAGPPDERDEVSGAGEAGVGTAVVVLPGADATAGGADRAARSGGPVLHLGGPAGEAAERVWEDDATAASAGRRGLHLADGRSLDDWRPLPGRPSGDARVVAVWEDGSPAAAVAAGSSGCVAYLAAEPVSSAGVADPVFPHLLDALLACGATVTAGPDAAGDAAESLAPLDGGALRILSGAAAPGAADLAAFGASGGRSLTRVLLALALLVAGVEAAVAYGRRAAP